VEGLFPFQLSVLRAFAKNLARAASRNGLLSSLISINMKDTSIVSPLFGASSSLSELEKSNPHLSVDNGAQQVASSVMSHDHESLENLLSEDRQFPPTAEFAAQANAKAELYDQAELDRLAFWDVQAKQLSWQTPWNKTLEWNSPYAKWFVGGKINASVNALDRHVLEGRGDRVAFHFEGEPGDTQTITYAQLLIEVKKTANALIELGVVAGDRVAIYMPMIPEAAIAMLACARIGAPHSVVFGGFSAEALLSRIQDADAKLVITADGGFRKGSAFALKPAVDEALKGEHNVQKVLVVQRTKQETAWNSATDVWWHDIVGRQSADHTAEFFDSEHPLFILYTAPTLIRTWMKWGDEFPNKFNLKSLRLLGSVGEPINPEAWMWYREVIGGNRCPIVDTWWQTETGGIMISPLPGVTATKPGSAMTAIPGISAVVVDDNGKPVAKGHGGYLILDKPWPGMLRGIWGEDERYKETYWSRFEEIYFAGDGAKLDKDGAIWLLGRVDDVMNVSGHRISTTEVESALVSHEAVAEAAVVGANDAMTGQGIVAFVILRGGIAHANGETLITELRNHVAKQIGAIAKPRQILVVAELPKTRSGKIMRRLLKDVAENRQVGDATTLADPNVMRLISDGLNGSKDEDQSFTPRYLFVSEISSDSSVITPIFFPTTDPSAAINHVTGTPIPKYSRERPSGSYKFGQVIPLLATNF